MRQPATQAQPALPRAASPVRVPPRLAAWLLAVLLVLGTMALYWPATRCEFVNLDDNLHVTANVQVQKGLTLESLKWAWLNPVNYLWQPLTVWSHMLDCQLFGLKPWGHHLTSVLLHAVNTGLVFLLLRRLTGALWRSVWVAALFGWHPLRVESVAWVAERKDVLSVFFGLLALMAYARYAQAQSLKSKVQRLKSEAGAEDAESGMQKPGKPETQHASRFTFHVSRLAPHAGAFYFLSLFLYALGLMSKPMLVTWPFVMLLLDYWPLKRNAECGIRSAEPGAGGTGQGRTLPWTKLVWEKIPFFVLAAVMSVVTFMVQKRLGILAAGEHLPLGARLGNALISYCRYLGKMFWPTDLAGLYPHPGYWPLEKALLAGVLLLGLSVLVWVGRRRHPYLLMGWLWYCGTLVPVSQVVQTAVQAMADRYTYVPSLGVLILTVWSAWELTRRWRYQVLGWSAAGGVAIVLCLALTRQQIGYWKDSEALWRQAVKVTDNNYLAHTQLGIVLGLAHTQLGIILGQKGQSEEAIRHYQEALRLEPGCAEAHYNLGAARDKKGQSEEAIRHYQEALRLEPDHAEAHNNLGLALDKKGESEEAIRQYQEALRLKPDYALAHNNLGAALDKKGQGEEAIRQLQEALRLKPDYADAHYNLGAALDKKGQSEEAIRQYQEALRLKPDYADAHNNLGAALDDQGQSDGAIRHYQAALRLKPDHAEAHNNLGIALGRKGQTDEAIRQFQEAVRWKSDYAEAHFNLGIAFRRQRRTDEAIRQFQEALRLKPDYAAARQNLDVVLATRAQDSPAPGGATNPP
jgi:protein O-mannosyl-transferase